MECTVLPTLNLQWIVATSLCIWFLFIHTPPVLLARDFIAPLFYVHLFGAYSIYLVCAHNTLLTPSTLGGAARPFHIWIGRVGLVLGIVGFVAGFILTWYIHDASKDLGFSIGVTYGGIAQMQLEFTGYRAIKQYQEVKFLIETSTFKNPEERNTLEKEQEIHLSNHIVAMIRLFVLACGIPALMRVGETIGNKYLPILFLFIYFLSYFLCKTFLKKMKFKNADDLEIVQGEKSKLNQNSFTLNYQGSSQASVVTS